MSKSEAQTRSELIDQQLSQSGWNVKDPTQVIEEFDILTALQQGVAEPRTPYEGHQFSDYVLLGKDRKPLAVVEAKKSSKDAIALQVTLQHADIEHLTPADIHLTFGPANVGEQIDTWKDVYGIEERYRGKLLGGDGKAWLVEVLDEWRWNDETTGAEGKTPDEYLRDLSRHTQKSPFANANFLKNSFLRGCKTAGLFDPIATGDAVQ